MSLALARLHRSQAARLRALAELADPVIEVPHGGSGGHEVDTSGTRDDIGTTPEGSETADTETWDIDSQASGKEGITIRMLSRVVYNHGGDEKLYGYYRTLTFDQYGHLVAVSAETRYEVDAPVIGCC